MTDPKWEATLQRWNERAINQRELLRERLQAGADLQAGLITINKPPKKYCKFTEWLPDTWMTSMEMAIHFQRELHYVRSHLSRLWRKGQVDRIALDSRRFAWRKKQV
jgi:hypothetical protein